MRLPKLGNLSLEEVMDELRTFAAYGAVMNDDAVTDEEYNFKTLSVYESAVEAVRLYLNANSGLYRQLQLLQAKDRENSKGDEYSEKQRRETEDDSGKRERQLNTKMRGIARAMHKSREAFTIETETETPQILDLCTSPGAFLRVALELNPTAHAVSFKLPQEQGGPVPAVEESETVELHMLDIATLAAHMGLRPHQVPKSHAYFDRLQHKRYLEAGRRFDVVICDGFFLGSQKIYGMNRETRRVLLTQLALGVDHVQVGGTMIIMLDKLEWLETIRLWLEFRTFAHVSFFKPRYAHAWRSYFYMIASDVQSTSEKATEAVKEWKREWEVATLGTGQAWRDEQNRLAGFGGLGIQGVLKKHGRRLVKLGRYVWKSQVDALAKYANT